MPAPLAILKRVYTHIRNMLFFVGALIIAVTSVALLWVSNSNKEVPLINELIEKQINHVEADYRIKIRGSRVHWNSPFEGLMLSIEQIQVHTLDHNAPPFTIENTILSMRFIPLLLGRIALSEIEINGIELQLALWQDQLSRQNTALPIDTEQEKLQWHKIQTLLLGLPNVQNTIQIEKITLRNSHIMLDNGTQESLWKLPYFSFDFDQMGAYDIARTQAQIELGAQQAAIDAYLYMHPKTGLQVEYDVKELSTSMLATIDPRWSHIAFGRMRLNGQGKVHISPQGRPLKVTLNMQTTPGSLVQGSGTWKGAIPDQPQTTTTSGPITDHRMVWEGNMLFTNIDIHNLYALWPQHYVGKRTYAWLSKHLKEGLIYSMELIYDPFSKEQYGLAWHTLLRFEDALLDYHTAFPPISNASGQVSLHEKGVDVTIEQGTVQKSRLFDAYALIRYEEENTPVIDLFGRLKGPLRDLYPFMRQGDHASTFLEPLQPLKGNATSHFSLKAPLVRDDFWDELSLSVETAISELTWQSSTEENTSAQPIAGNVTVTYQKKPGPKQPGGPDACCHYSLRGMLHTQDLMHTPLLRNSVNNQFSGPVALDFSGKTLDSQQHVQGTLDFLATDISIPLIDWHKSPETKTLLHLTLTQKGPVLDFSKIALQSDLLSIQATAQWNKGVWDMAFSDIQLPVFQGSGQLHYSDQHGKDLHFKAQTAHLGPLLNWWKAQDNKPAKAHATPTRTRLWLEADQALLLHYIPVQKMTLRSDCTTLCRYLYANGLLGAEQSLTRLLLTPTANDVPRSVTLEAEDIGLLLQSMGFSQAVHQGSLELSGQESPTLPDVIAGTFRFEDFRIKNAPFLTELLRLTSLTGIANLLGGKGMFFNSFKGDFAFDDSHIRIKNSRAVGSGIGITADGRMGWRTRDIDLSGAVIPSYSVNSFLGHIPLLGTLATGKEGEGILATRYRAIGTLDQPDIDVNPFSILTPGILRNIWGNEANTDLPSENHDTKH